MARVPRASLDGGGADSPAIRAVIYARMSTEHQQYSTQNQTDVIREYATKRNMEIIRSYVDEGKSGLRIDGRDALILERSHRYSDTELLDGLRALYEKRGWLSSIIIDECESVPSSCVYSHRFGGLLRAYRLVGYAPERDYEYLEINRRLREMHPKTVQGVVDAMRQLGGAVSLDPETGLFMANDEFTVSVVIARCQQTPAGSLRWNIRFDRTLGPDITVAVRLDAANENPLDYYLLPSLDMNVVNLRLAESNGLYLDVFRFDTLDYLFGMARRAQIEVA